LVRTRASKIIECTAGGLDDVSRDEWRALGSPLLRALDTALPLEHGPACKAILCELRKNAGEIDLSIAGRAESSCSVHPRLIAAIHTLPTRGMKLRVLHLKHF